MNGFMDEYRMRFPGTLLRRDFGWRFFADEGGDGDPGGGAGGDGSTPAPAADPAPAPASPLAAQPGNLPPTHPDPSFSERIINPDGTLKKDWKQQFADEIGDSKYFDSFNDLRSIIKSAKGLSHLAGRALVPKADAPQEEWDKVLSAMGGVPKSGEDYGFNIEGLEDEAVQNLVKDTGYVDRVADICAKAGLPTALAERVANASLERLQMEYAGSVKAKDAAREAVEKRWDGKVKWDDAVKKGREALAAICGQTADAPAEDMQGFMDLMDKAGLSDHPYFVSVLERVASRMTPGRFVTGQRSTPASQARTGFAAMAPRTYSEVLGSGD
jgi:hypothetical protein